MTEFLFPSLEPGSSVAQWKHEAFVDVADLNSLSRCDLMADNIDFCEVFTDIENLLSMDVTRTIEHVASNDQSTVDETLLEFISTVTPVVHPVVAEVIQPVATPDHSYFTVVKPSSSKRKNSETAYYDDADEGTVVVKCSKYLERRKKNNIASKRSRETRKNKFVEMDEQSTLLEHANERLRARIKELESLTRRMKDALVAKLSTAQ
jgi:hypothetical protein